MKQLKWNKTLKNLLNEMSEMKECANVCVLLRCLFRKNSQGCHDIRFALRYRGRTNSGQCHVSIYRNKEKSIQLMFTFVYCISSFFFWVNKLHTKYERTEAEQSLNDNCKIEYRNTFQTHLDELIKDPEGKHICTE